MFPTPIERTVPAARIAYRLALFASLAVWLLPMFGVALTSIRSIDDLNRGNLWGWPSEFRLVENYTAVFADARMAQFILNSVLITVPAVIGAVTLACMAGFALAKYRFRGNLALFVIFIAGNLVPFQILMIPVRNLTIATGLYDTRWALVLFHAAFQTGFCTLFMRNFIKQLPDDMLDAARNDGLSELQIFRHIVVPLVRPAIAAIAALTFTFVWNDYFWSLVLVQSDDVRPLTAGLQSLRGMWLSSWQLISAGSIVAAIPPVLIFFFMQQHFIAGLTAGAQND
ncbi:MAG: carbohydrate ABC transporter permease [Alphaproteobacteria bacterium]